MNKNAVMAIIVPADPHKSATIAPIDASEANLQAIVGGYLEEATRGNAVAYMNDNGKEVALQPNARATSFMIERRMMIHGDMVVGDVVILGFDDEGNEADVPKEIGLAFMQHTEIDVQDQLLLETLQESTTQNVQELSERSALGAGAVLGGLARLMKLGLATDHGWKWTRS